MSERTDSPPPPDVPAITTRTRLSIDLVKAGALAAAFLVAGGAYATLKGDVKEAGARVSQLEGRVMLVEGFSVRLTRIETLLEGVQKSLDLLARRDQ